MRSIIRVKQLTIDYLD